MIIKAGVPITKIKSHTRLISRLYCLEDGGPLIDADNYTLLDLYYNYLYDYSTCGLKCINDDPDNDPEHSLLAYLYCVEDQPNIVAIYKGRDLAWLTTYTINIRSCYGSGQWLDDYNWVDDDVWID